MDLKNIRSEYNQINLTENDLLNNPFHMFQLWFAKSLEIGMPYPNAADLSTIDAAGFPHSRIILIKEITDNDIQFYTDYKSEKGQDIERNNKVGLNIFWKELDRQVRLRGSVSKMSIEDSKKYFYSRPIDSQISAYISHQSSVTELKKLEDDFLKIKQEFKSQIPFPEGWGGYKITPHIFEFWQGRPSRLHDRFCYQKIDSKWQITRLSP